MEQTPKKINVIEYKGQLFKTQEEYNEYRRQEMIEQLTFISGNIANAANFLEALSANAINTKAKLDQLILDVKKQIPVPEDDEEFQVDTPGVNFNEEPDNVAEKEVEKF